MSLNKVGAVAMTAVMGVGVEVQEWWEQKQWKQQECQHQWQQQLQSRYKGCTGGGEGQICARWAWGKHISAAPNPSCCLQSHSHCCSSLHPPLPLISFLLLLSPLVFLPLLLLLPLVVLMLLLLVLLLLSWPPVPVELLLELLPPSSLLIHACSCLWSWLFVLIHMLGCVLVYPGPHYIPRVHQGFGVKCMAF